MSTPLARPMMRLRHRWFILVLVALMMFPKAARSDSPRVTFEQTFGTERAAELIEQNGTLRAVLASKVYSETTITLRQNLPSGVQLRFGGDVIAAGYPGEAVPIAVQTGLFVERSQTFGEGNVWQSRFKIEADQTFEAGDWVYRRLRADARLRYRFGPNNMTFAQVRLGYRDQNDRAFEGYDQAEYLANVMHIWRPRSDNRSLSGTFYVERRAAEAERFSYLEMGARLKASFPVTDDTTFAVGLTHFDRAFGSDEGGFERRDRRTYGVLSMSHALSDFQALEAYVGYDVNRSNLDERAYSGAISGINLRFTWQ